MEKRVLPYRASRISYLCSGKGEKLVLCFHGYGESAAHFSFLPPYLPGSYSFCAIDLPFHGDTEWKEKEGLTPDHLAAIVRLLLQQQAAAGGPDDPEIILLGFSLGGRIALQLYQMQLFRISKLVLLAPDGLKINGWYRLATQTWIGIRLFAFTMRNPGWFYTVLRTLNRLRMVNTSIYKFVDHYIGDAQVRRQLYQRWMALRKIRPDIRLVRRQVQQQATAVRFIYGHYDRIILPTRAERFCQGLEPYCQLQVIEAGHQVLHAKHAAAIAAALQC